MNCAEFQQALRGYFHADPGPEECAEVERHGAECPPCAETWNLNRELSCREFIEFLNEYVDGALEPERRKVFERHLGFCGDCATYLDAYRKTMRLSVLALSAEHPMLPPPPEGLIRAILAARKP